MLNYLLLLSTFVVFPAYGKEQSIHNAKILKYYGKVQVFAKPAKTKAGKGPFVQVDEIYYTLKKPKRGMELKPYERIQTGKKAKVKLIYSNGDQITVSANTSYVVKLEGESGSKKPIFDMLFGKIRGMIRSGGDRAGMKVRSSSMVMGVRGTDFYVSARGKSGASEVTVIRGKVAVSALTSGIKAEPVEVPAGFTVEIPVRTSDSSTPKTPQESGPQPLPIQIKPTTKTQVAQIFEETVIKKSDVIVEDNLDEKVALQLKTLELKAVENLKQDIKEADPELYEVIKKIPADQLTNPDDIQDITTKKAFDVAPKGKKQKASFDEFNRQLKDYDKYFK